MYAAARKHIIPTQPIKITELTASILLVFLNLLLSILIKSEGLGREW